MRGGGPVSQRDPTIDILRGLAILIMIGANMGASVLAQVPFWFRLYSSFAAPLFIMISGMIVCLTTQTKRHGLKHFIVRGIMIVTVGAIVDVFSGILPFTSVDVLYLIGTSLPVAGLFLYLGRGRKTLQWILVILVFLLTPIFQSVLGYTEYPSEYNLWGELTLIPAHPTSIINHWIVDGWFPLFPWLGFSLLGAILGDLRLKQKSFRGIVFLFGGIAILGVGSFVWWLYPGQLLTRAGYFELFYPPTLGFILTAIGMIIALFFIVDRKTLIFAYEPLRALGESSLFIYVFHLALIECIIVPIFSTLDFETFLLVYGVVVGFIVALAYGLRFLKSRWKHPAFVIRFLLGLELSPRDA
jgi:uncharacterized membrane protein